MLHSIKKVEYVEDYKLKLFFENRKIIIVDLEKIVKTAKDMLLPLKDLDFFKQVKCEYGRIVWPNGADLCSNVLYSMGRSSRKRSRIKNRSENPRSRRAPTARKKDIKTS